MTETLLAVLPLALIAALFLFYRSLYTTIARMPSGARPVRPWMVCLGLVPILGIIWNILIIVALLRRQWGIATPPGVLPRVAWMILGVTAGAFAGVATFPFIGVSLAIITAPIWIFFAIFLENAFEPSDGRASESEVQKHLRDARALRNGIFWVAVAVFALSVATFTTAVLEYWIWEKTGPSSFGPHPRVQQYADKSVFWLFISVIMALLCILLWFWSSQRKKVVLYLRKFHNQRVTSVLERVVRKILSGRFRLFTLDDAKFNPITSKSVSKIAAFVCVVLAFLTVISVWDTIGTFLGDGLHGYAQAEFLIQDDAIAFLLLPLFAPEYFQEVVLKILSSDLDMLVQAAGQTVFMLGMVFIGFVTSYVGIGIVLAIAGVLYLCMLARARLLGRQGVASAPALQRFSRYARRVRSRLYAPGLMSPPATVVTVADELWQSAVLSLADDADVVIFDVTEMTEAIVWEVEQMLGNHRGKCIFVAERESYRRWTSDQSMAATPEFSAIAAALSSQDPILYEEPQGIEPSVLVDVLGRYEAHSDPMFERVVAAGLRVLTHPVAIGSLIVAIGAGLWFWGVPFTSDPPRRAAQAEQPEKPAKEPEPLLKAGKVTALASADLQQAIQDKEHFLLVEFFGKDAPQDGVVQTVAGGIAENFVKDVRVVRADIGEVAEIAADAGVDAAPALVLYAHGKLKALLGETDDRDKIYHWFREQTNLPVDKAPCGLRLSDRWAGKDLPPYAQLAILGGEWSAQARLMSAMTWVQAATCNAQFKPLDDLLKIEPQRVRGVWLVSADATVSTDHISLVMTAYDDPTQVLKGSVLLGLDPDAIIIAIGSKQDTDLLKAQIQAATHWRRPPVILAVDIDDPGDTPATEATVLGILGELRYSPDDISVIRGPFGRALEESSAADGSMAVQALLASLSDVAPQREKLSDQPFLMPLEDVFSISGRGVVTTGRVERGVIHEGDPAEIVGFGTRRSVTVTGVEMFRKLLTKGEPGDNIGTVLGGLSSMRDARRGQVLAAPGSMQQESRFEAALYFLSEAEVGAPISTDLAGLQFYLRTVDVDGKIVFGLDGSRISPGFHLSTEVQLAQPMPIEPGQRFAIRRDKKTIGTGKIIRLLD